MTKYYIGAVRILYRLIEFMGVSWSFDPNHPSLSSMDVESMPWKALVYRSAWKYFYIWGPLLPLLGHWGSKFLRRYCEGSSSQQVAWASCHRCYSSCLSLENYRIWWVIGINSIYILPLSQSFIILIDTYGMLNIWAKFDEAIITFDCNKLLGGTWEPSEMQTLVKIIRPISICAVWSTLPGPSPAGSGTKGPIGIMVRSSWKLPSVQTNPSERAIRVLEGHSSKYKILRANGRCIKNMPCLHRSRLRKWTRLSELRSYRLSTKWTRILRRLSGTRLKGRTSRYRCPDAHPNPYIDFLFALSIIPLFHFQWGAEEKGTIWGHK